MLTLLYYYKETVLLIKPIANIYLITLILDIATISAILMLNKG